MTHARISANLDGEITRLPYNYVGDLLLYLQAQNGQPYAINWTIKISGSDFHEKRRSEIKGLAHQKSDREKARLRHLLEREYYADAGIRTLALSLDDIPDMVVANLDLLYGYHDLPIDIDASLLNDYSAELLEKSVQGIPPALVAIEYAKRWGHRDLLLARIYQEIWCRKLLVNLNKPILVDKPLWIGGPDLLDVYAHLFEEHSA
ncbi:transposase [Pseudomonas syringae]|nr:transposase [Pseudomonas syringae]